jgi:CheY-like chemotaxis protein
MDDDVPGPEDVKRTREFQLSPSLGRRPIVLVLDDDEDTCEAVQEVLDAAGFETVCLTNGELGLQHLHDHPETAVIILDLMMPRMNGWTFFDRVRSLAHLQNLPIIVMTGTAPYWGYPTTNVLHKPLGANEVLAAVRRAMADQESSAASG